jgi:hypothetical protein
MFDKLTIQGQSMHVDWKKKYQATFAALEVLSYGQTNKPRVQPVAMISTH